MTAETCKSQKGWLVFPYGKPETFDHTDPKLFLDEQTMWHYISKYDDQSEIYVQPVVLAGDILRIVKVSAPTFKLVPDNEVPNG